MYDMKVNITKIIVSVIQGILKWKNGGWVFIQLKSMLDIERLVKIVY